MSETIYGIHAVSALLTFQPGLVERIVVQTGRHDRALQPCLKQAKAAGFVVEEKPRKDIDRLFKGSVVHQGVVAFCHRLPQYNEADIAGIVDASAEPRLVLILDGVQDPHNLGACMRVANAMGAACVIAPKDNSASLTSTVIKVSCGAVFATPFIQVTNLARALCKLQDMGIWLVGASANAEASLSDIDMSGNIGVVMGAEGEGLRSLTEKHCDFLAKIPMLGSVESLNVSVATGVMLYEAYRQRADGI
ncbi:MAG: 23S rRNA (guanosine(2251)-2'-O)-methyltransferase RlmB [Coxiella sp. (in: Bacteria)]|nr:MAG: 23S rRNA (guanosine(2251)-2'-O)-methyltransferase RlmB [Coxiella sp. (in: g-proteobacteria)]